MDIDSESVCNKIGKIDEGIPALYCHNDALKF